MEEYGDNDEDDDNSMNMPKGPAQDDTDAHDSLWTYSRQRRMDLEACASFSEAHSARAGASNMNITGPDDFDPAPIGYNFHEEGRKQLHSALHALNVDLDLLQPKLPNVGEEPDFEDNIAQCLQKLANTVHPDATPSLPQANLLRASPEQRAAIAAMILPVLQRKAGDMKPPTRMKIFGEAGSGKTVVMHGQQRLMQRLHPKHNKTVLSLAPTGAVAIGMGPEGNTIQMVINQFRSSTKRARTSEESVDPLAVEKDMQLSPGQLKKLRACIGYDSSSGAMQVKFLVIEEISMVGAAMFWSIHCRLCQAVERHDIREVQNVFAALDVLVLGDFNQLKPVCATSLQTEVHKTTGFTSAGIHLFQTSFNAVIMLKTQHRLNLKNEQNARLRRLQLHVRDGELDDLDFQYARSLTLEHRSQHDRDAFLSKRVLNVHFYIKDVVKGNIQEVKQIAMRIRTPPSVSVNNTRGGKCANIEGEVNQIPNMAMYVRGLRVMCTANGLGFSSLTKKLQIANGTRGKIIAVLHAPDSVAPTVTIVDFPSYRGNSVIGEHWPSTWIPVAEVTRTCEKGCCTRTGMPLAPDAHVTLFKCQGLTCGKDRENECFIFHVDSILEGEKMWNRSTYVGLTRTTDAAHLALHGVTGLKKELWEYINNAPYHDQTKQLLHENGVAARETWKAVESYCTDQGWVDFLKMVDEYAQDNIFDSTCKSTNTDTMNCCAAHGCAACALTIKEK